MTDILQRIHDDIVAYGEQTRGSLSDVDHGSRLAIDTFLDALEDAEPYTQAHLTLLGYELSGGSDEKMIFTAARAVQMAHVYTDFAARNQHAIAQQGLHAALIMLANLAAADDLKIKALSITNRTLLLRANAQVSQNQQAKPTIDCYVTEAYLNPVHVGMVLAGADCSQTDAITAFVMQAGSARLLADTKQAGQAREHALAALGEAEKQWSKEQLAPLTEVLVPGYA